MLDASGYGVMSSSRGAAVDTFAINRPRIALILASTSLTDAERIRLLQALHRIGPYTPLVVAPRRASHRPNSGEDSGRHEAFSALIEEVERRLDVASAQAAAQAESFSHVQAPAPGAEFAFAHDAANRYALPRLPRDGEDQDGVFFPEVTELPPLQWSGSSRLTPVSNLDPRNYLRRLTSARRSRRKRIRRIGIAVAAACAAPLIVPPLVQQIRPTIARAIADDEPAETRPLASASISARIGIVPLVSSAHVQRANVADDLAPTSQSEADADAKQGKRAGRSEKSERSERATQPKRGRDADRDRSRRSRQR
jgi:hypothetical protein